MTNLGDRYELRELVAVEWNTLLRAQFPHAEHTGCRQMMRPDMDSERWVPFDPPRCVDWHCPYCGESCGSNGHPNCIGQP